MLRNYQIDICNRVVDALRVHRSVMVQMPTGTGKTVVLASLVNNEESCFNEELGVRNEEFVLIVAHRRELVEQIRETIRRMGIECVGISVCSIQWLSHNINKVAGAPSLVVIDEAHHALAKTYRMMWEAWPEAKFLGLTATPCRLNRAGFTDLFDTLVCSHSISWFIREGWLSLFDYYSIRDGSEAQRIIDSLEKRGADGDYQVKEMNAVLNRRPSIGRLYESVCRYGHNRKGIVYAVSIEHARNIADYYCQHGIRAVAVSSETPKCERERILSLFKDSSFRNCSSFCKGASLRKDSSFGRGSFFENSPVPSYPEEGLHLSLPNPLFPQEREGLSGAPRAGRGNGACGPADLPLSFFTQQGCDCLCGSAATADAVASDSSVDTSGASAFDSSADTSGDAIHVIASTKNSFFENSPVPSYPEEGLHLSLPNPLFPQEREGLSGAPRAGRGNKACGPADLPLSFFTQQSCDCLCGSAATVDTSAAVASDSSAASADAVQVLVSVDLFSEGFDCPDVEFIQLARPTLSLAKYLQMVGRGLRKSKGKECCVIIDNVGLYRLFGLPSTDRDWTAMFEGRMAGKGRVHKEEGIGCNYARVVDVRADDFSDVELEKVVSHDKLLSHMADAKKKRDRFAHLRMLGDDINAIMDMGQVKDEGFYIGIYGNNNTLWHHILEGMGKQNLLHIACILANDDTDWFFLNLKLDDGSIIVLDRKKNYYHVRDGKRKRYIGNEESGEEKQRLIAAIAELRLKAKRKTEHMKAEKLKRRLAQLHGVKPFMSGDKWGLQMGNRIIVPPIYKSIKEPVGDYCAVERTAQRWGVIQLDGKVVVDTCYQDIDIKKNGTACLTIFPGKTMKVKLG